MEQDRSRNEEESIVIDNTRQPLVTRVATRTALFQWETQVLPPTASTCVCLISASLDYLML